MVENKLDISEISLFEEDDRPSLFWFRYRLWKICLALLILLFFMYKYSSIIMLYLASFFSLLLVVDRLYFENVEKKSLILENIIEIMLFVFAVIVTLFA